MNKTKNKVFIFYLNEIFVIFVRFAMLKRIFQLFEQTFVG